MSNNMATTLKRKLSAKNVTAIILFGAILLVFVFFGLPTGIGGGAGAAARVNETLISLRDFQMAAEQLEQMYSQYMGGMNLDPEQRKGLQRQALERLIQEELTAQAARKAGIRATDIEIRDLITKEIPAFQKDGQFQREYYTGYLQSQRMNAGDFETRIRKQIEAMRIRRLFEASSHTLSLEADHQKTLRNYKMNLQFVKLDDETQEAATVSSAEAQKALENPDFQKQVENEFNLKKSQLSQPEQVRAQHILISFKPGDANSEKAALDKAQNIKEQASKGDFGALAAQHSEDPGSKTKKGDLGFFGRGAMVKEFEEAAFALTVGQISEPVKSPFGYHIIKVTDKKEAKEASLDEHRLSLAKTVLARNKAQKNAQELESTLAANPQEVESKIKALGLKWDETGPFGLDTTMVPKIPDLDLEKVAGLSASAPYVKTLVRSGNARYVVKLKEVKQETSKEENSPMDDLLQRRRADGMFTSWLNSYRKTSDIETNNLLFR